MGKTNWLRAWEPLGSTKTAKIGEMLFEEVEMLVVGDQLAWDPFGYGEVGVDHFVGAIKLARGIQSDRRSTRVGECRTG